MPVLPSHRDAQVSMDEIREARKHVRHEPATIIRAGGWTVDAISKNGFGDRTFVIRYNGRRMTPPYSSLEAARQFLKTRGIL